jgi:hypothetical protein
MLRETSFLQRGCRGALAAVRPAEVCLTHLLPQCNFPRVGSLQSCICPRPSPLLLTGSCYGR